MGFTRKWAETIANRIGMKVAEGEIADMILEGLNQTKGGCPCIPKFARTKDHNCPCKDAREKKECRCGLFKKKE